MRQRFTVESPDVEKVETVSREISSLIAQGVSIEAYAPDYYYTKLDDVKMGLIEKASADARMRAEKIAVNAGTKISGVASARMGVFQITGANSTRSSRPEDRSTPPTATRRPASPCGLNTGYDDRSRHCEASQMPRQSGRNAVTLHITISGLPCRLQRSQWRKHGKSKTGTNCQKQTI
ncbi:MAG: SIMPL domain-containing protein [Alistipes shahii]|uniref:SIMPL domain-containing protein n=1 Tax=Alistipes shahii TaxID=328814 RepID=UPI00399C71CB